MVSHDAICKVRLGSIDKFQSGAVGPKDKWLRYRLVELLEGVVRLSCRHWPSGTWQVR